MHNIYVVMIYVARGSVAWSESMICAHAIASPCNQATFECLCASRVASRPPIWSRLFYQEIYLYIYFSSPRFVAAKTSAKIWNTKGRDRNCAQHFVDPRGETLLTRNTSTACATLCIPPSRTNRARLSREAKKSCSARVWKQATMLRCSRRMEIVFVSIYFFPFFFLVEFESYCHEKKLLLKRKEIFTIRFYNLYCIVNICSRYVVRERNFCKIEVVQYEGMYVNFPLSIKFLISRIWNINKYQRRDDS